MQSCRRYQPVISRDLPSRGIASRNPVLQSPVTKCAIWRRRCVARRMPVASAMRERAGDGEVIIGVDVGGSSIAGGLVTPDGDVLTHAWRRTRGGTK